jgi:hypothetical protein
MYKWGFFKHIDRYYNDLKATDEENETFLPYQKASIHFEVNNRDSRRHVSPNRDALIFKLVKYVALVLFLVLLISLVRKRIVDSRAETESSSSSDESIASSFVFSRGDALSENRSTRGFSESDENFDNCKHLRYASIDLDKSNPLSKLCDLTVTVKTTKNNHFFKLRTIVDTWFRLVPSKVFFITDHKDQEYSNKTSKEF